MQQSTGFRYPVSPVVELSYALLGVIAACLFGCGHFLYTGCWSHASRG